MSKLPYLRPDKDYYYNLAIIMLIIGKLAKTKRGKLVLSIEKIQIFYFLVTRPAFLNKILELAGKNQFSISYSDLYSVSTISANVDELFNNYKVKSLIKTLAIKRFISITFDEKNGFLFELNELGLSKLDELTGGYYEKIINFIDSLAKIQSEKPTKINSYINSALKQG